MHSSDEMRLQLAYAPPGYASLQLDTHGRWVQLRRFGAGVVLATDDRDGVSLYLSDESSNPGSSDFANGIRQVLAVFFTSGHSATAAFDAVRTHQEFTVRGPVHHGRLAAAQHLASCIGHAPGLAASLTAVFDDETDAFTDLMLVAPWGIAAREFGGWTVLDEPELQRRYEDHQPVDLTAHGAAWLEERLLDGRAPSMTEVRAWEGRADGPHPLAPRAFLSAKQVPWWIGGTGTSTALSTLCERAKKGDWPGVFDLLGSNPHLTANRWRPGGTSRYTPLHQAAWHGAPLDVVHGLIDAGAWRTLRTAEGERAVDIARRRGHQHLLDLLEPTLVTQLDPAIVTALDAKLAELVTRRCGAALVAGLRHPSCDVLTEIPSAKLWYPVPGMYGGFSIHLREDHLYVTSWSRVVGGSGQAHLVTPEGITLVRKGFA